MIKKACSIFLAFMMAVLAIIPAQAITFGELDGNRHPNVGALVLVYPDGTKDIVCTGTLIAPKVFLTAAHCVAWMPATGIPVNSVGVSFDAEFDPTKPIHMGTYYFPADYGHDRADPHDVAVIQLDELVDDITPAELPTAGLLDQMKAAGELKNLTFVAVGYGTVREDKTKGPASLYWEGKRRFAEQTYMALTPSWLKISMNPSTGNGGTCYGDSGGPHFLGAMVVALTVTGDMFCRATDVDYRLDTPAARSFLGDYVDLP
jgi:secreted trypsin-like serine protease